MKSIYKLLIVIAVLLVSGCTTIRSSSTRPVIRLEKIYVIHNPAVRTPVVLDIIKEALTARQIPFDVIPANTECPGEYFIKYTALQSWDIVTYIGHAEVKLYKGDSVVSEAMYHVRGKGVFALSPGKYKSADRSIKPIVDRMLAVVKVVPQAANASQ